MELDENGLLRLLESDPRAHKLIHDNVDDRWFVYAFDESPPEVTSVPKDLAIRLLQQRWVEEHEDDRRGDLPSEHYEVFLLTEAGKQELARNQG